MSLCILIPGEPQPWQRVTRGKYHGKMVVPKETRAAKENIARYAWLEINHLRSRPLAKRDAVEYPRGGHFWLGVTFYLGFSSRIHRSHDPDLDNLLKLVKDALNRVVWHDDKQVIGYLPGTKKVRGSGKPRTAIVIIEDIGVSDEQRSQWATLPAANWAGGTA